MKTIALFCLVSSAIVFGCAHQAQPEINEPEIIFEEEKSDEGYIMLEDEDVGISEKKDSHP